MPFIETKSLEKKQIVPGFMAGFLHTENMTLSYVDIEEGCILPDHAHPHEQITHVLEGKLEFTMGGETRILEPGLVALIPSGVRHQAKALTDCKAVDVFYPVRDDYKTL